MDNEKKKREGSTIFVEKEIADRLDKYVKKHNLTRKSFVEKALAYFEQTGLDMDVWAFEKETAVPLSQLTARLEAAVKQTEEEQAFRHSLKFFMEDFANRQKSLPLLDNLQKEVNDKDHELTALKEQLAKLKESIENESGWGSKKRKIAMINNFLNSLNIE